MLTGSVSPVVGPAHLGAGRIVPMQMRPLSLAERGVETQSVSMKSILAGNRPELLGETHIALEDYVSEIMNGGFPGMRATSARAQAAALDGYLSRIVTADLSELGAQVRHPEMLSRWMHAYAAATSTTASYETIRDAATSGQAEKPATRRRQSRTARRYGGSGSSTPSQRGLRRTTASRDSTEPQSISLWIQRSASA